MCCLASVIRSPMTRIMRVGSTSRVPGSWVGSGSRAGWKPCISAWAASSASTPAFPSAVFWAVPLSIAARTSRSTMRPAGPEPCIWERSRLFSWARRLTIGEARKWPSVRPSAWAGASSLSGASVAVWAWASPSPASPSPPSSSASSAPPLARSGTSSPSPWIKAIAPPTGTSSPSSAIIWASVPASSASSSSVTLSVSISAIASPSETSSPSLLSHLTRVPSSIASPILGMITSGNLLLLHVKHPTGRVRHLLLAREGRELQVPCVRRRYLGPTHPLHRGVEVVERPVLDDRRHLARDSEPPPLLLHRHRPVRLLDRLDDGVLIKRSDGPEVYDLGADAIFLLERVGDAQAQVDLPPVGDERHVRALARYAGLAEGDGVVALLHLALRTVERASLEEDHAVVVADRSEHQPLDVVGGHGGDNLQPREVSVQVLETMRVLGGELDAAAVGTADDHRHPHLSAREVAHLGGALADLVRSDEREVPSHHLDDGPHALHRHPDGRPGEPEFRDGGVYDPPRPVLVDEAVSDEVGAAVDADVLAHQDDVLVAVHLHDHSLAQGLAVSLGLGHYSSPRYSSSPAYTLV